MSSTTQQSRLDRAYSTSSSSSSTSNDGWLVLNGDSSSSVSTPSEASDAYNPYLQLSPVTRPTFRPTENAEDRQRLFLLRARDN
ncbi:280dacc2-9864-48c7-959a-6c7994e72c12 [Sclerotinia trifoliorum]|uniref:280dacc2-9864-48c7-959a-6c7994e72c12 n=1 Tax=Sclerotinia trifoliorum TaxID=28548 RepID=A0A8H2W144_9HELO|nr:280dacc2-9864-48c7-959a-6c7994e72c12 [Sclerotinia trifoliorum]